MAPPHNVFDFVSQAGALMLANGAATAEVVQAMCDATAMAGVENVSVDVTYTELTLLHRPAGEIPYIQIQTVHSRNFNYGKLTDVSTLIQRFCRGEVTATEALAKIHRIETARGPYPWWLTRLAAGFAGANAALIFGGGGVVMLASFVANFALDYLLGVLARHRWPTFFMQAIAGGIAVLVAIIIHAIDGTIDSSRVVVSVIIVMLAGITSTAAVQDAITGWYLTALGRIFEAVMKTIGLVVGIQFGILVADRLGVDLAITANVSIGTLQLPVRLLAAAFVAIGFSFLAQNPPRVILPTALLSVVGYAVYGETEAAHFGPVWSSTAAAFVVGGIAVVCAQWLTAPRDAFAICAILPLLPGLMLYQGLLDTSDTSPAGTNPLVAALAMALALAGGLTFGEYFAIAVWRQLRFVENRFFAPLFIGPFTSLRRPSGTREIDASGRESGTGPSNQRHA